MTDLALPPSAAALSREGPHARRRRIVLGLNLATWGLLNLAVARVLGDQGWSVVDFALMACCLAATPWTVLGLWNSAIGLWLLHGRRDGLAAAAPWDAADSAAPVAGRVVVFMTLRNEDPARAFARLRAIKASVDATGQGGRFGWAVLSDSSEPAIIAAERALADAWAAAEPDADIHWRRRPSNVGWKAGNVREFLAGRGAGYELMVPLDADSLMDGATILRLVRAAEADPKIALIQSLVVGLPSRSAFARLFQFGMRHGMRAYTMGAAWWLGPCGPFWGHNAVVRVAAFRADAELPVRPGRPPLGGPILSHDQVEAALLARAGWKVHVLPVEAGSWEENPPHLVEFARRDLRWCQGNLQYLKLLARPGWHPLGRFQLAWAVWMFLAVGAWTLAILLAALKPLDGEDLAAFPAAAAQGLLLAFLAMSLAPKLCGIADVLLSRGGTGRYGGGARFLASAAVELAHGFLLAAVTTFGTTRFLIGLAFGRAIGWGSQARDAVGLSWAAAAWALWLPTLYGLALVAWLAWAAPGLLVWLSPLIAGLPLAIPFAVLTASPRLGAWAQRVGLAAIPEDLVPPPELEAARALAR